MGTFFPRVTWVHPSSSLLGWFPVSFSFIVTVVAAVFSVVAAVVLMVGVVDMVVVVVVFEGRIVKNGRAAYMTNIMVSYPRRPPSLIDRGI